MKIISIFIIISIFQITLFKLATLEDEIIPIYHEIQKSSILTLNFASNDTQEYAYINYQEDDGIIGEQSNKYHYLLINSNLSVTCRSNYSNHTFPNSSEFNKDSLNECLEMDYDLNYKIIRYNRVLNMNDKTLFVFYLSNLYYGNSENYQIKRLLYHNELIDNKIYSENTSDIDIKLYYFEINENNSENLIYISEPNNAIIYAEHIEKQKYVKLENYYHFFKLYNNNNIESEGNFKHIIIIQKKPYQQTVFNIGRKSDLEKKFKLINFTNQYEEISSLCDGSNIYILNSPSESIFKFPEFSEVSYKLFKDEFIKFEDLFNLSNYKEINNLDFYSKNKYAIYYITCNYGEHTLNFTNTLIKEENETIYLEQSTYFKISSNNNLTFDIVETNYQIVIKLLSEDGLFNINEIIYSFKQNEIKIINLNENNTFIIKKEENSSDSFFEVKFLTPETLISYLDYPILFEVPTNTSKRFIIMKFNSTLINDDFIYNVKISSNSQGIKYYQESGYKNLNEISVNKNFLSNLENSKEIKIRLARLTFDLDLDNNNIYYHLFYFDNISPDTKLTINFTKIYPKYSYYFKPNNNFDDSIIEYYTNLNQFFFVLPCNDNFDIQISGYNIENYHFTIPNLINRKMIIGNTLKYKGEAYLNITEKKIDENYTYNYCPEKVNFSLINDTHFRYDFSTFSNSTSYYKLKLLIVDEKYLEFFNTSCDTLKNLNNDTLMKKIYMNTILNENLTINKSEPDCSLNAYYDGIIPDGFNLKDNNYIIRGIGQTSESFLLFDKIFYKKKKEPIYYNKIEKNKILYLNFSVNSLQYAYLDYNSDYEKEDKDTENQYYFLLINNKLNVNCLSNYKEIEFPNETEFNNTSDSSCKIINYNETNKIIRYDKVKESYKNLFVFYLSNSSELSENKYEVKKLSFPKRLEEKMNNIEEKQGELKILFFNVMSEKEYEESHIFYLPQKRNYSMFYELREIEYQKSNHFGKNILYQFKDYYLMKNQNVLIIYEPDKENNNLQIEYKIVDARKYDISFLKKDYDLYDIEIQEDIPRIIVLNSDQNILLSPKNYEIDIKRYDLYKIKSYKGEIKEINDLNNLNNYEIIINDNFVSSDIYIILYVTNTLSHNFEIDYQFIEEKGNIIYMNNKTYFSISNLNTLSFSINDITNNKIILELLSNNKGNININSKDYSFEKNEIKIVDLGNLNSNEVTIISKEINTLTFSIKSDIPENKIKIIDFSLDNFTIPTKEKEIFIIYKINEQDFEKYQILHHIIRFNNFIQYSYNFGYYSLKEISIIHKTVLTDEESLTIDLETLKKINAKNEDKSYYIIYYFSNIKEDSNITISPFFTSKKLKLEENKFIKLEKSEEFFSISYVFYEKPKIRIFGIPCNSLELVFHDAFYLRPDIFFSFNKSKVLYPNLKKYAIAIRYIGEGYLYYHFSKNGEFDYFYNNSCSNQTYIYFINNTHLRYSFSSFSNSSEINYSLIIVENDKYINSSCDIFNNSYLNPIKNDDIEILSFTLENITINQSLDNCSNNSYIDIEIPNLIKKQKVKKNFIISGMGITGPIIKDVIIYDKIQLLFEPKNEPEQPIPSENDNKLKSIYIIFISIAVILAIVIIILFKRTKRKKNDTIDTRDLAPITELTY